MWVVAGVLLGIVVLASLIGFHAGPHSHALAGVAGVVAALWLIIMAMTGQSAPVLWALLSADVVVSAGVGIVAWKALRTPGTLASSNRAAPKPIGADGVALTELAPDGVVRVRGESWSATSLNGPIPIGARVQVVDCEGIRLQVWRDEAHDNDQLQELPS